jgi:protein O-GlcNAc transferase
LLACFGSFALGDLGKHDEAIRAYDKAIELKPDLAEAWIGKSMVLRSQERTIEADAAFAKAKELGYMG